MPTLTKDSRQKIWDLIKSAHSALLVTIGPRGLESRPMGCLQTKFDGKLWFITFQESQKIHEIAKNDRVLVSYTRPSDYEYVSVSGRAEVVHDRKKLEELWFEGLKVWFPNGPNDPKLALLCIEVDQAEYWTNAASVISYAWAYLKARFAGESPSPDETVDTKTIRF